MNTIRKGNLLIHTFGVNWCIDTADNILLNLSGGLKIKDLSVNEKDLIISKFGIPKLKEWGLLYV